jgi:predicted negative regulator of RcsB-dependent stress response
LLGGWQYWQKSRIEGAEQDEAAYLSVIDALGRDQRDQAVARAKELRDRRPSSPYADQADLALARMAVDRREFDAAAARLRTVMDGSKDPELRHVARTRLARVLLEQGKHDECLAVLDPAKAGEFAALYREIRGDAYAAKGDAKAARSEYDAALADGNEDAGIDRAFIELKRDALPSTDAAVAARP